MFVGGKKYSMKTATRGTFKTLQATQKSMWGKIWGRDLANKTRVDPRGVPWDQNFSSKIFHIVPMYDMY